MSEFVSRFRAARGQHKLRDVEELIDFYWHRPVAALLVAALYPTQISPNQVTVLSGAFGLLAGVAVAIAGWSGSAWLWVAAVLLFLSVIFDCADGQLARMRGTSDLLGRALDGMVDVVAPLAVFHGMAIYLVALGQPWWLVFGLGWVAGGSYLWHSLIYDHIKNLYLNNSVARTPGYKPFVDEAELHSEEARYRSQGRPVAAWVVVQFGKHAQLERGAVGGNDSYSQPVARNESERALFVRMFRQMMRNASYLGIGSHLFIMMLALLLTPLASWAIWVLWAIYALPYNWLAISSLRKRDRLIAQFMQTRGA